MNRNGTNQALCQIQRLFIVFSGNGCIAHGRIRTERINCQDNLIASIMIMQKLAIQLLFLLRQALDSFRYIARRYGCPAFFLVLTPFMFVFCLLGTRHILPLCCLFFYLFCCLFFRFFIRSLLRYTFWTVFWKFL